MKKLWLAIILALLIACDALPPSEPDPPNTYYEVLATCDARVTYRNVGGNTEQRRVSSGWTYLFDARLGQFLYISGQLDCRNGGITVSIYKWDRLTRAYRVTETANSSGDFVIASASGRF